MQPRRQAGTQSVGTRPPNEPDCSQKLIPPPSHRQPATLKNPATANTQLPQVRVPWCIANQCTRWSMCEPGIVHAEFTGNTELR